MKTGLDDGPPDSIIWHKNRRAPIGINIRATIQGKYIATFGDETRTADNWSDLINWLKHHGKAILHS